VPNRCRSSPITHVNYPDITVKSEGITPDYEFPNKDASARMTLQSRAQVLQQTDGAIGSHVAIRFSLQILHNAVGDLLGQAGRTGRLKQRQVIEFVIIIVNYCKSRDLGVHVQLGQNLIAARPFRHVGYDIIVGNPPIAGAKKPGRIVSPRR
jgi:hypothetical protein